MTYLEALRLRPGKRVQVRQTGKVLNVLRTERRDTRTILVHCDNGAAYPHKVLNRPILRMGIGHETPEPERRRIIDLVSTGSRPPADNGTWFEFENGDLEYAYKPDGNINAAMAADPRKLVRRFQA